jgi:hypothetical protein
MLSFFGIPLNNKNLKQFSLLNRLRQSISTTTNPTMIQSGQTITYEDLILEVLFCTY